MRHVVHRPRFRCPEAPGHQERGAAIGGNVSEGRKREAIRRRPGAWLALISLLLQIGFGTAHTARHFDHLVGGFGGSGNEIAAGLQDDQPVPGAPAGSDLDRCAIGLGLLASANFVTVGPMPLPVPTGADPSTSKQPPQHPRLQSRHTSGPRHAHRPLSRFLPDLTAGPQNDAAPNVTHLDDGVPDEPPFGRGSRHVRGPPHLAGCLWRRSYRRACRTSSGLLPNRQRRAARTQPDEAAIRGRIAPHATGLRRTAASARNPPESRREPPAGDGKGSASDRGGTGCGGRHGSPTSSGTQHRGSRAGDAPGCRAPARRRQAVRSSSRSARRRANPGPLVRSCRPPPRRPAHSTRRSGSCWKARPDISARTPTTISCKGFRWATIPVRARGA